MHQFDQDILLSPGGDNRYKTTVAGNWSINGNPDGGYLMALLAQAALGCSEKRALSILTANFISRCEPGGVELSVESMGATRHFDRWQVKLVQGGEEKVRSMATLMDRSTGGAQKSY